jgi:hypothetical protein
MDIQIKSSRAVLATDNAVKKLVALKSEETSEDSFLRMGVKPEVVQAIPTKCFLILINLMEM